MEGLTKARSYHGWCNDEHPREPSMDALEGKAFALSCDLRAPIAKNSGKSL